MDGKQYDESLLTVLTFCESLDKIGYYPIENGKAFGMTRQELYVLVDSLNRNLLTRAVLGKNRISFTPLTLEGREKLKQLRNELRGQSIHVRFQNWILNNWHYFLLLFKR